MPNASEYAAFATLRSGKPVEIRALRPEDRTALIAAVERSSLQSLYRRFLAARRSFSEREIAFFVDVDFIHHVALVAVTEEDGGPVIAGGGRYVVVAPEEAEVAVAVVDDHQGQGIGTALIHHLMVIAQAAGIRTFIADVLPDNAPMRRILETTGHHVVTQRMRDVVHMTVDLT